MHLWHSRVDEGSKGGRRAWRVSALLPPFRLPLAQSGGSFLNAPRRVGVPRAVADSEDVPLAQGARTNPCGTHKKEKPPWHKPQGFLIILRNL